MMVLYTKCIEMTRKKVLRFFFTALGENGFCLRPIRWEINIEKKFRY